MLASSRGVGRNVGRWYNFMMSLCGGMRASRPTDMIYGTLCNKDGGAHNVRPPMVSINEKVNT